MAKVVSGLLDRDPVPGEVEASHDDPRRGWSTDGLHQFTQDETDILVRSELHGHGSLPDVLDEADMRKAALGEHRGIEYVDAYQTAQHGRTWMASASEQRGGIDSDPLVRLLAFRAWGDRDRSRGDVDAIVERYRVKLGLRPWSEFALSASDLQEAGWHGHPSQERRSGRTTLGILTTLAKCEAWGIGIVMLNDTRIARDHVYPELLTIARRLGVGVAIRVSDRERRGNGVYIAHLDHYELETRRDQRDPYIAYSRDE